ncbi:hypothetical protein ACO0LV_12165 [Pseudactinotalea sp. Z1739]|uniref:hypothetical protein n=1 Tax=Pseudactinotalea sp. Z1739 TaxID=3413028 RepID=UPI003C7D0244
MRLIEFLRKPSAFIAANWAGLLGVLTVGGAVPAFAGNQRVTSSLATYADEGGVTVLRQLRHTWWRDLPATACFWVYVISGSGTVALMVGVFEAPTRVFFAGLLVPVYWVAGALLGCYIRAAATVPVHAPRGLVVDEMVHLALAHPFRALLTVPMVIATAPVWALAPLTVACGLSVPAWALSTVWGRGVAAPPRLDRFANTVSLD